MRDIPGYEGRYAATKGGKIWAHPSRSRSEGYYLCQAVNDLGYSYVCLFANGKRQNKYVHRLVALAFLGRSRKPQVNHKNGKRSDNRLANLEWATASENKIHAFKTGLTTMGPTQRAASRRNIIAHNHKNRFFSMAQATEIRRLFAKGKTRRQIADKFGASYGIVKQIIANDSYVE